MTLRLTNVRNGVRTGRQISMGSLHILQRSICMVHVLSGTTLQLLEYSGRTVADAAESTVPRLMAQAMVPGPPAVSQKAVACVTACAIATATSLSASSTLMKLSGPSQANPCTSRPAPTRPCLAYQTSCFFQCCAVECRRHMNIEQYRVLGGMLQSLSQGNTMPT